MFYYQNPYGMQIFWWQFLLFVVGLFLIERYRKISANRENQLTAFANKNAAAAATIPVIVTLIVPFITADQLLYF